MSPRPQRHRIHPTPGDFVPVSALAAPMRPVATPCGALKTINGAAPLRCTLAAGHVGDHGQHYAGKLIIRWSQ
jgi:hypothetical protein